jgi:hypothetical protein
MNCQGAAEALAGRWHGEIDREADAELERHLAGCETCRREAADLAALWEGLDALPVVEPPAGMRARFEARMEAELARERGGQVVPFAPPQTAGGTARRSPAVASVGRGVRRFAAIAATLAIGVLAGSELARRRDDRQIEALRGEVASLHETVATALLAGASPSERLRGVAYGRSVSETDARVAEALIAALERDPDVNVRLAAIEALRPLAARSDTRPRLVAAAAGQQSPLVQLSLVEALLDPGTGLDPVAGRADLAGLLADPKLDPAVAGYLRGRLGGSV